MARVARQKHVNECRQCSTFCDRVIKPSSCIASGCPALYQYDDPLTGRRYMGCLHKVFATEIDIELFEQAEKSRSGFGVVKLAGAPRERCAFSIERAFPDVDDCVNRRFFDWPEAAPGAVRAFDLRDRL
jgi:hypothetical protein